MNNTLSTFKVQSGLETRPPSQNARTGIKPDGQFKIKLKIADQKTYDEILTALPVPDFTHDIALRLSSIEI